jgi:hypothetical protein
MHAIGLTAWNRSSVRRSLRAESATAGRAGSCSVAGDASLSSARAQAGSSIGRRAEAGAAHSSVKTAWATAACYACNRRSPADNNRTRDIDIAAGKDRHGRVRLVAGKRNGDVRGNIHGGVIENPAGR